MIEYTATERKICETHYFIIIRDFNSIARYGWINDERMAVHCSALPQVEMCES